jgi:hypothetical protein
MTLTQVVKAIFPHTTQTELFGELACGRRRNDAPPRSQKRAALQPLFVLVRL